MSVFGVSSNIGACSSHIYSNPVTIAAIKRQQEKARLQSPEYQAELKAKQDRQRELAIAKACAEEKWHAEFQASITLAWKCSKEEKSSQQLDLILSKYRQVGVHGTDPQIKGDAEQIIRDGAAASGFKVDDIRSNRRYRPLVKVRQALMGKVYVECPHLSVPQIGRKFNKDHSTVHHALMKLGVHYSQTGQIRVR